MTAHQHSESRQLVESFVANGSPLEWRWPLAPESCSLYDKYTGTSFCIRRDDAVWVFTYRGGRDSVVFAEGRSGELQRRLVMLMAAHCSCSFIQKTAKNLVRHWASTIALLTTPAHELRDAWEEHSATRDAAAVNKGVLKIACSSATGPWAPRLLTMVRSLDTRANAAVARCTNEIESRRHVISTSTQAEIVRVLDAAARNPALSEPEIEGACALALIFQHAVRPVQLFCVETSHVRFFKDADDDSACIVSFHAAKQEDGKEFEVPRQVKPEWSPLVARLHEIATDAGRTRIFQCCNTGILWKRVQAACRKHGFRLNCTARDLRHTGAQTLADAGHSRRSIRDFLAHVGEATATVYIRASLPQADLINSALGASKLYSTIAGIAAKNFVTADDISKAAEDFQIGGVVGDSLVAGIGLCRTGQSACAYNPITSCYGCPKFMPSLDREMHLQAVEGMRQQVRVYLRRNVSSETPAYRQLMRALAGAQHALDVLEQIRAEAK